MTELIIFALIMTSKKTYPKEKQTIWLLSVALLLSIFSFSGYLTNSQSLQQATQTELVLTSKHKTTKRVVSFYNAFEISKSGTVHVSNSHQANYLLSYNRFIEIRFKNLSKQPRFKNASDHLYLVKTIPQNSNEDHFISFIG